MTRLLLLRHGQSEWNAVGRWQGWADPELAPLGRLQAEHAGARLAAMGERFASVVSSDLARSLTTAEILAAKLALGPPAVEPGFREFDVGEWSGLTRAEIEAAWPGDLEKWRHGQLDQMPGGETRDAFVSRIFSTLLALAARDTGAHSLVVTHGGVISTIERTVGAPARRERLANLQGRWFDIDGDDIEVGSEVVLLDPELESPAITPVP